MKIIVFGNGLVGRQLAAHLVAAGHDARALGRDDGIDTTTGEGSPPPSRAPTSPWTSRTRRPGPTTTSSPSSRGSTEHLLAAEREAGVGHHVILSIVGADRLPDVRLPARQGRPGALVEAGGVPYSIVRSTQFFEFVPGIADAGTVDGVVHATSAHLQPIASRDVVAHLAEVVAGPPLDGTVEIAGPEPLGIDDPRPPALRHHRRPPRRSSPTATPATSAPSWTTPP